MGSKDSLSPGQHATWKQPRQPPIHLTLQGQTMTSPCNCTSSLSARMSSNMTPHFEHFRTVCSFANLGRHCGTSRVSCKEWYKFVDRSPPSYFSCAPSLPYAKSDSSPARLSGYDLIFETTKVCAELSRWFFYAFLNRCGHSKDIVRRQVGEQWLGRDQQIEDSPKKSPRGGKVCWMLALATVYHGRIGALIEDVMIRQFPPGHEDWKKDFEPCHVQRLRVKPENHQTHFQSMPTIFYNIRIDTYRQKTGAFLSCFHRSYKTSSKSLWRHA